MEVPLTPLQHTQIHAAAENPNAPPLMPLILMSLTLEFTVNAIRHAREKMWKHRWEVCDKGCRDRTKCEHIMKFKEPTYWTNTLGYTIPKRAAFLAGNRAIFRTTSYQQEILDDLTIPRAQSTDEEVGRHYSEIDQIQWSRSAPQLTVTCKLLFPPFQQTQLGLPLILFQNTPLSLKVHLAKLSDCYFSNDGHIPKLLYDDEDLKPQHLRMRLYAEVLQTQDPRLLNPVESIHRPISYYFPYFENHTGMLDVHQGRNDQGWNSINIRVRNEILEILWILQPHSLRHVPTEHHPHRTMFVPLDRTRNPYNWGGFDAEDCISHAELCINGTVHVSARDAKFFRQNNHKVHLNKPKNFIYGHSWTPTDRADVNTGAYLVQPPANQSDVPIQVKLKFQPYVHYCKYWVLLRRPESGDVVPGVALCGSRGAR